MYRSAAAPPLGLPPPLPLPLFPPPLQLFEVLDTEQMIYLIMENADKGEMFDYIVRHQVRLINTTTGNQCHR